MTIHDANDDRSLYTEITKEGNYCSPYSFSWISTEDYKVDVCRDKWFSLDEKNMQCANGTIINLKRLAIGNDGCYPYGNMGRAYIDALEDLRIRGYE